MMPTHKMNDDPYHEGGRKRVCKACDRCRLKKSKCDGIEPCLRCKADNAVCIFTERKKSHEKAHPRGYAEMLEQQQAWLVSGLQALYHQNIRGQGWSGEPLKLESNGFPLTHDLLSHLGVLNQSGDFGVNTNHMFPREPVMQGSTPHSPHTHISQHSLSPVTPDMSGDVTLDIENPFTKTLSRAPQFEEQVPYISNQWAIQDIPPWPIEDFGLFDDMDMMLAARNPDLLFDDSFLNESMDLFTNENARGVTLT